MKIQYLAPATTTALAALLLAAPLIATPAHQAAAQIGIGINITANFAPPLLPVYEQPPIPEPGYIWTPGYWAWGDFGYYWVPGTWVQPPTVGLLWTPAYWGWNNGVYVFNRGYWGPHVGFYGGINYGFGYGGFGYEGGEWRGGVFAYNRVVNNFGGVHITNVYERNVTVVNVHNNVSFNGPNGVNVKPRPEEVAYMHEAHVQPTPVQVQHVQMASHNHALLASVNHGRPAIAATPRPAAFSGPGVVAAHPTSVQYHPGAPAAAHAVTPGLPAHPGLPPLAHPGTTPHVPLPQHHIYTPAAHPAAMPYHPGYAAPAGMAPHPMHPPAMAPRPAPAPAPHPAAASEPKKPHR